MYYIISSFKITTRTADLIHRSVGKRKCMLETQGGRSSQRANEKGGRDRFSTQTQWQQ